MESTDIASGWKSVAAVFTPMPMTLKTLLIWNFQELDFHFNKNMFNWFNVQLIKNSTAKYYYSEKINMDTYMRAFSSFDLRRYLSNFPRKTGEGDKDDGRLYFIHTRRRKNQMLRAAQQNNLILAWYLRVSTWNWCSFCLASLCNFNCCFHLSRVTCQSIRFPV